MIRHDVLLISPYTSATARPTCEYHMYINDFYLDKHCAIPISNKIQAMANNLTSEDLCKAIQENDSNKVHSILAKQQDSDVSMCIDAQNSEGWTALMFAAKHNDIETAQDLIKRRLDMKCI